MSEPSLIMMVGLPYSGKSEYAKRLSETMNATIHSSDAIRQEILGDAQDQSEQVKVFEELHRRVREDLLAGKSAIYDATNISYKRRMGFLQQLGKIPCRKICYFMATPFGTIIERSHTRDRVVPMDVVAHMYKHIWIPYYYEGWDEIHLIYPHSMFPWNKHLLFGHDGGFCNIPHDNPHHDFPVGDHCLMTYALVESSSEEVQEAALLHDIGKPFTKSFVNSKGETTDIAHYYQHHHVSAYDSLFYSNPNLDRLRIAVLINWHMRPYEIDKMTDPSKGRRDMEKLLGEKMYREVMAIHAADLKAH